VGDRDHVGGTGAAVRRLRSRWRIASITSGWRFPSDWAVPEVDTVCGSALFRGDLTAALTTLGGSRARTGAGLDVTLYDVAAFHAVLGSCPDVDRVLSGDPHAPPLAMLRAAAVGWADVGSAPPEATTTGPYSGLATKSHFLARLGEVYQGETRPADSPVLLAIDVDLSQLMGCSRSVAMALVADVLHRVFDGGETAAALSRSTAVVLAELDAGVGPRIRQARRRIADRLSADPRLAAAAHPRVRLHHLPDTLAGAHELLNRLAGHVPAGVAK
jgi:hypothetical protein